jgi:hypothetical protein
VFEHPRSSAQRAAPGTPVNQRPGYERLGMIAVTAECTVEQWICRDVSVAIDARFIHPGRKRCEIYCSGVSPNLQVFRARAS